MNREMGTPREMLEAAAQMEREKGEGRLAKIESGPLEIDPDLAKEFKLDGVWKEIQERTGRTSISSAESLREDYRKGSLIGMFKKPEFKRGTADPKSRERLINTLNGKNPEGQRTAAAVLINSLKERIGKTTVGGDRRDYDEISGSEVARIAKDMENLINLPAGEDSDQLKLKAIKEMLDVVGGEQIIDGRKRDRMNAIYKSEIAESALKLQAEDSSLSQMEGLQAELIGELNKMNDDSNHPGNRAVYELTQRLRKSQETESLANRLAA